MMPGIWHLLWGLGQSPRLPDLTRRMAYGLANYYYLNALRAVRHHASSAFMRSVFDTMFVTVATIILCMLLLCHCIAVVRAYESNVVNRFT